MKERGRRRTLAARGALLLALGLLTFGCQGPATQVLVWVDVAEGTVRARARELQVRVRDGEGAVVLEETRRLVGDAPLQGLPASISLLPKDGDSARSFEVEVVLLEPGPDGAVELMRQGAEGSFVPDEVREIRLRFEDNCLGVTCGEGRSCRDGRCVRACYAATPPGEVTRSDPSACPCRCSCPGDRCEAGACVPAQPVAVVSLGSAHACAVGIGGEVWCWGDNTHGQLGLGDQQPRPSASRVELPPAKTIAAGPTFTCAALLDGTVRCFGGGDQGQLGSGAKADSPRPVLLTHPSGRALSGVVGLGAGGVVDPSTPSGHACAVLNTGELWCWGRNNFGQLGQGTTAALGAPARVMTSLAGDAMAQVELGGFHTCARQRIGRVWCFGHNHDWQLGFLDQQDRAIPEQVVAEGFSAATQLAAGTWHSCAVAPDQRLWCWGEDAEWRLGMGNPDGSDDEDRMIPTLVPGAQKWAAVSAGHRHTCAREEDGSLWCFGTAAEGELGVRAVAGRPSAGPSQLKDQPWVGFDLGNSYSCGVREGGALYCWGRNDVGQLGIGGGPGVGQPARVCLP